MGAAGYAGGLYDGPPVRLALGDDPVSAAQADVITSGLGRIGITVERETYPIEALYEMQGDPKSGIAVSDNGWCWDYPDGVTILKPLFDGRLIVPEWNSNLAQINDGELNQLIDRASLAEGAERATLWAQVDHRVMELAPVVPLRWNSNVTVVSERVRNYRSLAAGAAVGVDLGVVALD